MNKYPDTSEHPSNIMQREDYGVDYPRVCLIYLSYWPVISVRCPEMLQDLYVQKNKFFDKQRLLKDILYPLVGDSVLLAKSDTEWQTRRKSLSQAFYKDKLIRMVDIVKSCMD